MIIHSTILDTESKVINQYGGTTWIQHTGYFLRGASSGVTANSATSSGGDDNAYLIKHNHKMCPQNTAMGTATSGYGYGVRSWVADGDKYNLTSSTVGSVDNGTNRNIPKYKSVYIWERTS